MEQIRTPNNTERRIIAHLVRKANLHLSEVQAANISVQTMDDGGMGSFKVFPEPAHVGVKRRFGHQASEYEFLDDDGVLVLVSLNLDEEGQLLEVDIWKTDYNPVLNLKVPDEIG